MSKYLNPEVVCRAFERLSSRNIGGKVHLERTSVLMYFLSVDATCQHFGASCLDLNPDSSEGKYNRKQVEIEFTKLVLVESAHDGLKQVNELGKIDIDGTSPEKRISSNFLTVPLKKASSQMEPYYYPRRPKAPVLKMGPSATGKKWGVGYHDEWTTNFLTLLASIKSSTPLLDLALFVCRNCAFDDGVSDIFPALGAQLEKRFTKDMADFWISRIGKERVLALRIDVPFVDHYLSFARYHKGVTTFKRYDQMKKTELIGRIHQLESMMGLTGQAVK